MKNNIFQEIENNNIEFVKKFFKSEINIRDIFSDDEGKTPLMAATEVEGTLMLQTLLDLGCDLFQATTERGDNVLTWCAKWGFVENFDFLAKQMNGNFNINYQNGEGNTPLILAAYYGNSLMMRNIAKYEPDIYIKNSDGETVLDILRNSKINDRTEAVEEISKILTEKTINKIKKLI